VPNLDWQCNDSELSSHADSEDSILSSDSKIEKKNQGMQAMNWSALVGNGVQPQR
jgi:hypothetical protein